MLKSVASSGPANALIFDLLDGVFNSIVTYGF